MCCEKLNSCFFALHLLLIVFFPALTWPTRRCALVRRPFWPQTEPLISAFRSRVPAVPLLLLLLRSTSHLLVLLALNPRPLIRAPTTCPWCRTPLPRIFTLCSTRPACCRSGTWRRPPRSRRISTPENWIRRRTISVEATSVIRDSEITESSSDDTSTAV